MYRIPVLGRVAAAAIVSAALLAGCGGGGGSSGGGGGYKEPSGPAVQSFSIDAHNFGFNPDKLQAQPGVTSITLTDSGGQHTLKFDGAFSGFLLEVNGSGDKQNGKVDLKAGKTYTFYCDLPGHRAQGMQGTITVSAS
jgi:plastocyanin